MFNPEESERKTLLILKILSELRDPAGARVIARRMAVYGLPLSERTVRYHLKLMDERGLTKLLSRKDGRVVTEAGREELSNARVRDKIGFSLARIEILAYRTTLDPATQAGLTPVNVSFFPAALFAKARALMKPAFAAGLCVSDRVAVAEEGQALGELVVPAGCIGLATVCSIVINGVLLKHGVPMDSKFGGILQIRDGRPLRFVELIHYSGSSLDPSEIFILGNMTSVRTAASRGEGKILANFRDIPVPSRPLVERLVKDLDALGIRGALAIGEISEPICQTPVDANKLGMILLGGLNPVACAREGGIEAENRAMSTLMAYEDLIPFRDAGTP